MTPGEIATVITAVLGVGGIGALGVHRYLGLGNGNSYKSKHLRKMDELIAGQREMAFDLKQLCATMERHENATAKARDEVHEILVRAKVKGES